MEIKKLIFIIGAGASKAITSEKIPAMSDFFHIANNFAKDTFLGEATIPFGILFK